MLCAISMAHEYNDVILYIVSSLCSHALVKVARTTLHKLESWYRFGKLFQRDTEFFLIWHSVFLLFDTWNYFDRYIINILYIVVTPVKCQYIQIQESTSGLPNSVSMSEPEQHIPKTKIDTPIINNGMYWDITFYTIFSLSVLKK